MRTRRRETLFSAMVAGLAITALSGVAAADTAASTWDRMHDSPAMEQMREQMPAGLQEQCDEMHDRMGKWMEDHPTVPGGMGNMMNGHGGMMGGPLDTA